MTDFIKTSEKKSVNQSATRPLTGRKVMYVVESGERVGENIRQHMQAICALGAHLTTCCLSGKASTVIKAQCDVIIELGLSPKQLSGNRLRAALALRRILIASDSDTLVCDQYKAVTTTLMATIFSPAPRSRIIALLRGYYALSSRSRRRVYRLFSRKLSGIIALTTAQKQHFLSLTPWLRPEQVHVVPNYLDYENLRANMLPREQARQALGLSQKSLVIGCIARFDPYKRLKDLVAAMPEVLANQPLAHLSLIGQGRTLESIRKQTRELSLQEHVTLHGYQPDASRLLKAFDIFVFPSEGDNFARVLLEAMAAELPIIAADAAGTPEVVADKACLVPPRTPQAIAAALLQLAARSATQREKLGQAGYCFTRQKHTQSALQSALQKALEHGAS